jgi:cation transport regulator ChaC
MCYAPAVSDTNVRARGDAVPTWRWYFAYGSNMDPDTFVGRRRMCPREACVARLDGWALCFDLPVGPGERGVANLRSQVAAATWGVAYRIAAADCERLDRSEGVDRGFYVRRDVVVRRRAGRAVEAFTYESTHRVAERRPSARYLGLLLRGAHHHGLPASWIAHLEGLELAVDERLPPAAPVRPGPGSSSSPET